MSAKMMGQVWDLKLDHSHALVLLAMADHADHKGGRIFPSIGLIAWKTGYSARQVRRIIRDLEKDGLLILVRSGYRQGGSNLYQLNLPAGKLKEPYRSREDIDPSDYATSDNMTHVTMTDVTSDAVTDVVVSDVTKRPMTSDIAVSGGSDIAVSADPSLNRHIEPSSKREREPQPDTPNPPPTRRCPV